MPMSVNPTFRGHSMLLSEMAETLGVDLAGAVRRGDIAPLDLVNRVYRCQSCSSPDICSKFIAAHKQTGARLAPCYCRNKEALEQMARVEATPSTRARSDKR
ncbi:DUF6455 family protein [Celeribacter sp.]|uniref:DUF6455 family protein n=1 Tax=Celeribacter sp. TaxID=1890673 RepID=UPI003A8CE659